MTGPDHDDLALALDATYAAGAAVMRSFRADPEVRHKAPGQPVTDADLEADRLLGERLRRARPGYGWLSEETVDRPERLDRTRVWVVDPIDGTRSYIAGYREFAVSVALAEDGEAVVGVVYNPARREVFWAVRDGGAFRVADWSGGAEAGDRLWIGRIGTEAPPAGGTWPTAGGRLASGDIPPPADRRVLLASRSEIARHAFDPFVADWLVRPLGSTAYKLAGVAGGLGDAYVSRGPKSEWDVAAGALIVQEAGGRVTDLRGEPLRYNRPEPHVHGVLAAAPGLFAPLLERVRSLPSDRLRPWTAEDEH